ncbi:zinc-ribbon domain containing protein [Polaromonas sp. LjRoot131]|uniref:zinc-ribbon domain containing protein n=1 Tax=Polaromonas sp. LjRoot131 TaxID=3342262 RepID=UPI003ECD37FF
MKSNKQRRTEILEKRKARAATSVKPVGNEPRREVTSGTAPCNPELLAPSNSYGTPAFVQRGYYMDVLFKCQDCAKEEIWRAAQQKWWYEVAKGNVETRATRCNPCRRIERERRDEARRVHLEGVARKNALKAPA